jgi:general stress protein 26
VFSKNKSLRQNAAAKRTQSMNQEIIARAEKIIDSKTGYIGDGMEGYAALALIDENGYPTASTLTIAKADGIKWLTFNTSLSRNTVKRIQKCNRAGVCINSSEYNITLVGTVEILTDSDTKNNMWFPVMANHWSGPDDPEYCVLRFTTERYSLFVGYEEAKGTLKDVEKKQHL